MSKDNLKTIYNFDFQVPTVNGIPIWNFQQEQDFIQLREPLSHPTSLPNPDLEWRRATELNELRNFFSKLCQTKLGIPPPPECFNRWLFDQLSIPDRVLNPSDQNLGLGRNLESGQNLKEPVLRYPETASESDVIRRELLAVLPSSLYINNSARENLVQLKEILGQFCLKGRKDLQAGSTGKVSPEERSRIDTFLKKTLFDVNRYRKPEEIRNKIEEVKEQTSKFFEDYYRGTLDLIIQQLITESRKVIQLLHSMKTKEVKLEVRIQELSNREGFFLQLVNPDQAVPINQCFLTFLHFYKLLKLYDLNAADPERTYFLPRLYCLVRRYETFFGKEGVTFHAASTEAAFDSWRRNFGLCQENYASPFNCYFRTFNSAFPDTDIYFGSRGSFYDFFPLQGSFETGPPYTEEVMDRMIDHLTELLSSSDQPLSFFVVIPDWRKPLQKCQRIMESVDYPYPYTRAQIFLPASHHRFVVGDQHRQSSSSLDQTRIEDKKRFFTLPFDTKIYLLQNEAGATKWPSTPENLKEVEEAYFSHR